MEFIESEQKLVLEVKDYMLVSKTVDLLNKIRKEITEHHKKHSDEISIRGIENDFFNCDNIYFYWLKELSTEINGYINTQYVTDEKWEQGYKVGYNDGYDTGYCDGSNKRVYDKKDI